MRIREWWSTKITSEKLTDCIHKHFITGYFGAIECARILHSNQQQKNSLQSQSLSSATVVEPITYQVHVLEASQSVLSKVLISGEYCCRFSSYCVAASTNLLTVL
jgi:hypothetical protein